MVRNRKDIVVSTHWGMGKLCVYHWCILKDTQEACSNITLEFPMEGGVTLDSSKLGAEIPTTAR